MSWGTRIVRIPSKRDIIDGGIAGVSKRTPGIRRDSAWQTTRLRLRHAPSRASIRDSGVACPSSHPATSSSARRVGSNTASIVCSARVGSDRSISRGGSGNREPFPAIVCVKVSARIDGWLREAYFGQLLQEHPRAIRVFDTFPTVRATGHPLYCLALEYARHGDLSAFLARSATRFSETATRREIAGILGVLGKLHRGQALHRDLTPLNVFVCDDRRLKLGDFGIVRQQSDERGVTAHTMNALTAPSDLLARAAPKWQARDDVYQVGQLLGMLIKGDARTRLRPHDVRRLHVLGPFEGDRVSLHRRAAQTVRERRRDDRRAPDQATHAAERCAPHAQGRASGVHRHSDASAAARRCGRRDAPARSPTGCRRRGPRWWCGAGRIRCRPRAAMPG